MSQAEELKNKGNEAFKKGAYNEALDFYSDAIKADPTNYLYYSNRSAAYQKLKQYDRMIRDAQKCIELNPSFVKGYFRLATGYKTTQQFTEAFHVLQRISSLNIENEQKKELDQLFEQVDQELNKIYQQEELNLQQFNHFAKITEYQGIMRINLERNKMYYEQLCKKLLANTEITFESIIKQLDPILKPLKSLPTTLTEQERQQIIADYEKRYRPNNRFNWHRQLESIQKLYSNANRTMLFVISAIILTQYARPELTEPFLKKFIKMSTDSKDVNQAQGWLLMALKEICLKGHTDNTNTSSKSLQYLEKAMSLVEQHENVNVSILTTLYLEAISIAYDQGSEAQLETDKLKQILEHLDELMFLSSYYHSWIVQEGMRFWFQYAYRISGAIQQLQELLNNNNNNNVELATKIFNAFNSADLPLPKTMMNPFFLRAISNHIMTREDLERLLTLVRASCLQQTKLNIELRPLFYALSLQCHLNGYLYMVSRSEQLQLKRHIAHVEELLLNNDYILNQENELSDMLTTISMYKPLYGHIRGIEKLILNKSKLPYALIKLLELSLYDEIAANKINVPNVESELLLQVEQREKIQQFYNHRYTFGHHRDLDRNLMMMMMMISIAPHREIEWNFPQLFWPKGYESIDRGERQEKILSIVLGGTSSMISTSLIKYGHTIQLDQVELISDQYYRFTKNQVDQLPIRNQIRLYYQSLPEKQEIDMLQICSEVICMNNAKQFLENLVHDRLRPGGIAKIVFIGYYLGMMIKDTREYLYDHHRSNIFKRGETIPIVNHLASLEDIHTSRAKLLESEHFKFYSKVYDFYHVNSFCDLIFNPIIHSTNQFYTFENMNKFIESIGLKIISIDDDTFTKSIQKEYRQFEPKDVKCRDWKALDRFATNHRKYFRSMIHIVCEKPVQDVKVDLKRDPLGVKAFLHKYTKL